MKEGGLLLKPHRTERPTETLSAFEQILRDLLIFIVAMSVVLAALLVIISRMPNDNPLKRILVALSYRVGATAAAGMLVIPATPIPGLRARTASSVVHRPAFRSLAPLPQTAPSAAAPEYGLSCSLPAHRS